MRFVLVAKGIFVLALLVLSYRMYVLGDAWFLIDTVNLIFHEAGHVIFFLLGNFVGVLGGTLGEIGIPLIITGYFLFRKEEYGAGFGFWWLSTALWSVSIYSANARAQALPLITGNSEDHDWTYLLSELGILEHDQLVGGLFLTLSITALILSCMYFYKDIKNIKTKHA